MNSKTRNQSKFSACGLATVLLTASLAVAKSYDIAVDTLSLAADVVDKTMPAFPEDEDMRKGQEGWVQLNFVVAPDGSVVDPIVVDSVGGEAFEQSAVDAVSDWTFEPSDEEVANNSVAIRFERSNDSGKASRNFMRWYKMILTDLASDKVEDARANLERAKAFGGWNLYESSILAIVEGRVADGEGNDNLRREALRQALNIGDSNALNAKTKRELLASLVRIETEQQRFVDAGEALDALRDTKGHASVIESLEEEIRALEAGIAEATEITVPGVVSTPCDRESGQALWAHKPSLRHFAIENIDGDIERVEARCDSGRLVAPIDSQEAWSIPEAWGDCEVFVFGEDGASFAFVESPAIKEDNELAEGALASSIVQD
ncbi:MAG: TonB family protein [Woeseiaceae bacterium]|nr:TonB family protein [Woeseiaceae bacterium]